MAASGFFILLILAISCCAAPNLKKDHCQKPQQIKGLQLQGEWPDETYPPGKVANFVCLPEYTQEGPFKMACIEGTWWPIAKGQCKVKTCDKPDIKHGHIWGNYNQVYPASLGSRLYYYCDKNYQPRNWTRISCTSIGWEPEPKCSHLSSCQRPERRVEAELQGDWEAESYPEHTRAVFQCRPGYTRLGLIRMICLKGKWETYSRGQCRRVTQCHNPPTIENGIIESSNQKIYTTGDVVKYSCRSGFHISGSDQSTCMNGHWSILPTCTEIGEQCGPPPIVQYGDTVEIRKANYTSGEKVKFKCPEYYILDGNRFVTCLNGVWNEAPVCLEPCTAKENDMEYNSIQIKWISDRKLYSKHGDTIEFICKPGYEAPPDTQMRITCEHGKLEYPKCFKRGFCVLQQSTMIANNIHYNLSTVVDHGQTILFQCNDGMMAENKLEAKCEWRNISYSRCTAAKSCKTPEILNGFLKAEQQTSYDSGSYVEFDCNEDYVINVAIKVKCENGQWSKLPVCYSPCKISLEELTIRSIQLLSTNDQKNIKNIADKNYKHGTEIGVTCKSGFRRPNHGAMVIECYDGKFMYPRCFSGSTCRIVQDDLDENNLELDDVHDNEVFYADGEIIQFKCKNGFHHLGQPTGTCSGQELSYPTCTEESSV